MKKKLKKKVAAKAEEVVPEVVAVAPPIRKLKKKKRVAPAVVEKVEEPPPAPVKKKLKKKRKVVEAEQVEEPPTAPAKKKLKKKRKVLSTDAAAASTKPDKKEEESDGLPSDEEGFFAKDGDNQEQKNQKVPDHMNPLKVFVGGLPWAVTEDAVHADFAECGAIERFDMPLNDQGRPSGNAYIYYKSEEAVAKALEFDGTDYQGRSIKVKRAVRQEKDGKGKDGKGKDGKGKDGKGKDGKGKDGKGKGNDTTVFVGGLSFDTEYDTLKKDFEECGEVTALRMVNNPEGSFKGIAFVVYKDEAGVAKALEFDGDSYGDRTIKVSRAGDTGGKSKDKGKGKDKGKDKGKGKGKDKGKGGAKGVCYKFQAGNCTFGDSCIFSHEQ